MPDHHVRGYLTCKRFENPWPIHSYKSAARIFGLIKDWARRKIGIDGLLLNNTKPTDEDFREAFPVAETDWKNFTSPETDDCICCIWRLVPPSFSLDDPCLPKIDFVIISHNHYDHLDYNSVVALHRRFGDDLTWYVPLCLKNWFLKRQIKRVFELDWHMNILHPESNLQLTFTPSQHWSNRTGIFDKKRTLWGGWLIRNLKTDEKVWFVGDTGYTQIFKDIGNLYGPIDFSLIPIGAYEPEIFLKYHVNPEQAVQIHRDVGSKVSMAIHCCTFCLTLEPLDEPPYRLKKARDGLNVLENEFFSICHGECLKIKNGIVINKPRKLPVINEFPLLFQEAAGFTCTLHLLVD